MESKKAQEGIIVTVLLVLVAIAAVSAVAYFIANQVSSGVSEAELKSKSFEIYAEKAQIQNGFLKLTLSRGSSTENFTSLKIVMTSGGKSQTYNYQGYINSLETVDISIPLTGDFASAKSIATDIYPVINEKIASKTSNINAVVDNTQISGSQINNNPVVDASLISYWNLDLDAKDYSGHSYDGTPLNGALLNTTGGKIKGAYKFDGVNDYINTSLKLSGKNITYGAWMKFNSLGTGGSGYDVPLQQADAADAGYEIYTYLGKIYCYDGTTDSPTMGTGYALLIGTWTHIVCVHTGTNFGLYANGQLVGNVVASSAAVPSAQNFVMGGGVPQSNYWFNGSIDEVITYNRSLSATEVKAIYDATK